MFSRAAKGLGLRADAAAAAGVVDGEGDTFFDSHEAFLHPDAHEEGGLTCRDAALLERQRG
jgi:hypothetical protein